MTSVSLSLASLIETVNCPLLDGSAAAESFAVIDTVAVSSSVMVTVAASAALLTVTLASDVLSKVTVTFSSSSSNA